MDNSATREITLLDLWKLLVQKLLIILLAAIIAAVGFFAYSKITYKPEYSSTATLYILKQTEESTTSDAANAFSLALKVVNDCSYMLKSHAVLDQVIADLDLDMSYEDLSESISTNNPADTRILEVTVTTGSAAESKRIVDALCQIGPQLIDQAMGAKQLNLFEQGTLETEPSNDMGIIVYALVAITAAVLTYCVFLLQMLLDDRVHADDDLEERLGLSILGEIPSADAHHLSQEKYGKYERKRSRNKVWRWTQWKK